jgi:cytochrome c5
VHLFSDVYGDGAGMKASKRGITAGKRARTARQARAAAEAAEADEALAEMKAAHAKRSGKSGETNSRIPMSCHLCHKERFLCAISVMFEQLQPDLAKIL